MLDIATVLTTMFVYVDDFCNSLSEDSRKPGPEATMSDSEVVTLVLFCELVGKASIHDQIRFAEQWLRDYFPHLLERSRYHRRTRRLLNLTHQIREQILKETLMHPTDMHIIDSTPIPVVTFTRAGFTPLFREAAYGRCAARNMTYFGFKLHLVTDHQGIPIHFDLAPANIPDIQMAEELLQQKSRSHLALGDKGYISKIIQEHLFEQYDITFSVLTRANQKERESREDRRIHGHCRQIIEVVNGILKGAFNMERTFAKTTEGLVSKIMNKMTAFTFGIYLNRLFGREALDFANLVS